MLIGEPPRSQADIHFTLFGFPIRVHPFFWVITVILGLRTHKDPVEMLIWVAAVFVSILIHELGHALTIRFYGGDCWITLYGMGGLASSNWVHRTTRQQVLISAAGPAAGFALAAILLAAVRSSGHDVWFTGEVLLPFFFDRFDSPHLYLFLRDMLFINFAWGILNLLPIYPLDGGQIARELLVHQNPGRGIIQSLWLSVFTAGCLVVFGLTRESLFMAFMFGFLGYQSYATLQAYTGRGGGRGW